MQDYYHAVLHVTHAKNKPNGSMISMSMSSSAADPLNLTKSG